MGRINSFIVYFLISIQKKLKGIVNKNQAIYYKKIYGERFIYATMPFLGNNFYIDLQKESSIEFNGRFVARGTFSIIGREKGKIKIGNDVFFNIGCSISCFKNVIIGNNVMLGENVKIYDHNHQYKKKNEIIANQGYSVSDVIIGNNCWIGSNVIILKGVSIGDNVVIGAGVVINKNIPANQVIISKQDLIIKAL